MKTRYDTSGNRIADDAFVQATIVGFSLMIQQGEYAIIGVNPTPTDPIGPIPIEIKVYPNGEVRMWTDTDRIKIIHSER